MDRPVDRSITSLAQRYGLNHQGNSVDEARCLAELVGQRRVVVRCDRVAWFAMQSFPYRSEAVLWRSRKPARDRKAAIAERFT